MKNYLQIELGGEKRGLKFNMNTFEKIQELTGVDPLQFRANSSDYGDIKTYAITIIHAALLSNCESKGGQPDFTGEDVAKWYGELALEEVTNIINVFQGKKDGSGEAEANTQLHVAGA